MVPVTAQTYDPAVPLDELIEHPRNPRKGDDASVGESIDSNGFYGAIVVQRSTRHVLAGHTRRRALLKRGDTTGPVFWLDVDDETALRVLLADNRTAELAEWDDELLAATLRDLAGTPLGFEGSGFDEAALAALLDTQRPEIDDDESDSESETLPLSASPVYDDATIIDSAFEHYRERGFPYPALARHQCLQQINALAAMETDGLRTTNVGYHIADVYHPQRFAVKIDDTRPTPTEQFARDDRLRQAFAFMLEQGVKITDNSLLSTLALIRGAQLAAQFRPGFALWCFRQHGGVKGARILDTSAGWGGRVIGFAASDASEYVGIDPSSQAVAGNERMINDLAITGARLIQKPAEDVQLDEIGGADSFDLAMTSPPYFSKERYSDEPTQSFARYPKAESWRDGFLVPLLRLQHDALKRGATNIVNIADVTMGGKTYPLVQWAIDAGVAAGFELTQHDAFPIARVPGGNDRPERAEACLIFRKPA